jgi:hypothetical protein
MNSIHDIKAGPLVEQAPWKSTMRNRAGSPRNIVIGIATLTLAALLCVSFRGLWAESISRQWYFMFGDSAEMRTPSFPALERYLLGVGKADITGFENPHAFFRSR